MILGRHIKAVFLNQVKVFSIQSIFALTFTFLAMNMDGLLALINLSSTVGGVNRLFLGFFVL